MKTENEISPIYIQIPKVGRSKVACLYPQSQRYVMAVAKEQQVTFMRHNQPDIEIGARLLKPRTLWKNNRVTKMFSATWTPDIEAYTTFDEPLNVYTLTTREKIEEWIGDEYSDTTICRVLESVLNCELAIELPEEPANPDRQARMIHRKINDLLESIYSQPDSDLLDPERGTVGPDACRDILWAYLMMNH